MNVRPYQDDLCTRWDDYVLRHAEGTLFHSTSWKRAIERGFGYESRYLLAEEGNEVRGVLPLFVVSNWVQGRVLMSTPFAVYGGICASDEAARQALLAGACQLAEAEGVQYLELRERTQDGHAGFDALLTKQLYVTFDCALGGNPELLFRRLPKDTRYMIRKAQKNGLRLVTDNAQLQSFYEIYAHSVHDLGTPVFAKDFVRILIEEFPCSSEVSVVWSGQQPLAAVFSFRFRDWLLPYYGGSLPAARSVGANNLMYWELIRQACERGLHHFDFGRSKRGTGSHFFKTQWSMEERPLPYRYYLVHRKTLPNFSPVNPRFKLAIALWKHVPFSLTKALGPSLVRFFP